MDTITFSQSEKDAFRTMGVTGVILFGSQSRGMAGDASDYDFGVLRVRLDTDHEKDLYEGLYDLFSAKIGKIVDIDIVFLDAVPMELCHHVAKYGLALYEAIPGTFARFKEMVMDRYADFAPYRRMFQEHILRRIPT